jgi:cytochrome c556
VLVKQRQAAMTLIAKYFGPVNGMRLGKVPFNADVAARNAAFLETLSKMPWDGFQPSTKGAQHTRALPAIFDNPAKFKEAQDHLQAAASKLAAVTKGDESGFKAAAGELAKTCGACHNDFRQKD